MDRALVGDSTMTSLPRGVTVFFLARLEEVDFVVARFFAGALVVLVDFVVVSVMYVQPVR